MEVNVGGSMLSPVVFTLSPLALQTYPILIPSCLSQKIGCSAEGLKGVLCLLKSKAVQDGLKNKTLKPISDERLEKAINVIITYQNEDGGT